MKIFYNIAIFLILACFSFGLMQTTVLALEGDEYGLNTTANQFVNKIPVESREVSVASFVGRIINVVLSFVGIIFLILIIYGGFMWMTAGGAEEKVGKAIQIFTSSGIGLIIVIAAYLLTKFIGSAIINSLK